MRHSDSREMTPMDPLANHLRYLNHLAKSYPSLEAVAETIINLQAQLNLPKGTEHFISDILEDIIRDALGDGDDGAVVAALVAVR